MAGLRQQRTKNQQLFKQAKEQVYIDDKTTIVKRIGDGATATTYLVERVTTDLDDKKNIKTQHFALKVFDKLMRQNQMKKSFYVEHSKQQNKVAKVIQKMFSREVKVLAKHTDNKGIIQLQGCGKAAQVTDQYGETFSCPYILMDYAENGTLFDLVEEIDGGFGESGARFFFRKLVRSLMKLHQKGVAHLDIKPENILIDSRFNPKLADFGESQTGATDNLTEFVGTLGYQCPQLLRKEKYDGKKADIFSLGVILFIMATGMFPFHEASEKDIYYKHIMNDDRKHYFELIEKETGRPLSDQLKDLLFSMWRYEEEQRATLEEVYACPWTQNKEKCNSFIDKLLEVTKTRPQPMVRSKPNKLDACAQRTGSSINFLGSFGALAQEIQKLFKV